MQEEARVFIGRSHERYRILLHDRKSAPVLRVLGHASRKTLNRWVAEYESQRTAHQHVAGRRESNRTLLKPVVCQPVQDIVHIPF